MIIDRPSRLVELVAMAAVLSQAYAGAPEPSKGRAPRAGTVELILGMPQVPPKCPRENLLPTDILPTIILAC
jgi:hypothetical protein